MNKTVKLLISAFVGLDIFVFSYVVLAQLRLSIFGTGAIPGGGSALDMALFLLPLFVGYVAGDRLYYFLNYKERKQKIEQQHEAERQQREAARKAKAATRAARPKPSAIWDDAGWDEDTAVKAGRKQE